MDINELDPGEKAVIRALQRLGKRWPKCLRLISVGGGLNVAYSAPGRPDQIVAAVPAVPLGGEWQRDKTTRWVYTFSVEERPSLLKQEDAVRLLLTLGRVFGHAHRLSFDERGWRDFRDSAARAGMRLVNIQRVPELPAEDVL